MTDTRAAIATQISQKAERLAKTGLATLETSREIGDLLKKAKVECAAERKKFGAWCDVHVGFSRTWRSKLIQLAQKWPEVEVLVQGSPSPERLTVEKALAALNKKSRAEAIGQAATIPSKKELRAALAQLEAENDRLKMEISILRERENAVFVLSAPPGAEAASSYA